MIVTFCPYAPASAPDDYCAAPASVLLEGGCVHEHIAILGFCRDHADLVLAARTLCRSCWLAPDHAHRCLVTAREVSP